MKYNAVCFLTCQVVLRKNLMSMWNKVTIMQNMRISISTSKLSYNAFHLLLEIFCFKVIPQVAYASDKYYWKYIAGNIRQKITVGNILIHHQLEKYIFRNEYLDLMYLNFQTISISISKSSANMYINYFWRYYSYIIFFRTIIIRYVQKNIMS